MQQEHIPRVRNVFAAAILLAAAACEREDLAAVDGLEGRGEAFTNALAHEYRQFLIEEEVKYLDLFRAQPYIDKATRAADGEIVLPGDNAGRITGADGADIDQARVRLLKALNDGGRDQVPAVAAKSQVKFDCWLERSDANIGDREIRQCHDDFHWSLSLVEETVTPISKGTAFTKAAAREYLAYSHFEADQRRDYIDSRHFAAKGISSKDGDIVLPEKLGRWNLTIEELPEFLRARARLINALDGGGREVEPKASAVAQVNFDCWVERTAERENEALMDSCRRTFESSIGDVERALGIGQGLPREDLVAFFDFDRADIRLDAEATIEEALRSINALKPSVITLVGHADRAGPAAYNMALSLRRAESVRARLIEGGIAPDLITPIARGEREPAIPTEDGVPNQENRRVEIILQ